MRLQIVKSLIPLLLIGPFTQAADSQEQALKSQDPNVSLVAPATTAPESTILSFLEWKSLRVHEAQQKVEQMNKTQENGTVWQEGKSSPLKENKQAMTEEKLSFNVDVALQLNIQDYFSMYLKNLSVEDIKEASKKLSDEEVSDLLIAYKNSLEKEKKPSLKFSKGAKDNAKSRKE